MEFIEKLGPMIYTPAIHQITLNFREIQVKIRDEAKKFIKFSKRLARFSPRLTAWGVKAACGGARRGMAVAQVADWPCRAVPCRAIITCSVIESIHHRRAGCPCRGTKRIRLED